MATLAYAPPAPLQGDKMLFILPPPGLELPGSADSKPQRLLSTGVAAPTALLQLPRQPTYSKTGKAQATWAGKAGGDESPFSPASDISTASSDVATAFGALTASSEAVHPSDATFASLHTSVGSLGHPHCCMLPCKFALRPGRCKDALHCRRCHLCKWTKGKEKQKRAYWDALARENPVAANIFYEMEAGKVPPMTADDFEEDGQL
eukprot:TRINITY_DN2275_c0_g3_i1.p2 TRINITY_DN2275_c0_g3~~TRINITY_DN2275_c0_g3_i1.p2  ORF type:complete len:206 (-),score=46.39 TRINITY_DN2275_c0_g3_i1:207-824(-)